MGITAEQKEVIDLFVGDTVADAERQLLSALEPLPSDHRRAAEAAFEKLMFARRLESCTRSIEVSQRQLTATGIDCDTRAEKGLVILLSAEPQRLPDDRDSWAAIAPLIGESSITAARFKDIAASAGRNITITQAARKLYSWAQSGLMTRTQRGVYAFNKEGRTRYGIDDSGEGRR